MIRAKLVFAAACVFIFALSAAADTAPPCDAGYVTVKASQPCGHKQKKISVAFGLNWLGPLGGAYWYLERWSEALAQLGTSNITLCLWIARRWEDQASPWSNRLRWTSRFGLAGILGWVAVDMVRFGINHSSVTDGQGQPLRPW